MKKWVALLAASVLVFSSPSFVVAKGTPDKNQDKVLENVETKLIKANETDLFPVIVMFSEKIDKNGYATLTSQIGSFSPKATYTSALHGFAATLTKKQIQTLQKQANVKKIELDRPVQAYMQSATDWFGVSQARTEFGPGLDGDRDSNPTSYSKQDVVVAVIDTGIDNTHVDLDGGKVIGFKDFIGNKTTPYDDNGHGSHVAGIIAGTGEGSATNKGVAPGAALVGVKVLSGSGSGTLSGVISGIDWCIANKSVYNIQVINMSLGANGSSNGTDAVSVAATKAVDAGITVVVAAGNAGPGLYTIGTPGAAEKVITVGAMADVGELGFNLRDFSSRGPTADGRIKPDIAAPGYNITSVKTNSTNGYVTYSGTSMATPFTAGVAALMLDANETLTPLEIKSYLTATTEDWGPEGKDIDFGYGRLQAYEAIKAAKEKEDGVDKELAFPEHNLFSGTLTSPSDVKEFTLEVTNKATPVSISMVTYPATNGTMPDFELYVYGPNGKIVGQSETPKRQEQVSFKPLATGTYKIKVTSYAGTGPFFIDTSSK